MKGGQAFAAVEGRRRACKVRDEEGAPPVANLGRSAHCGPKRGVPEEHAKVGVETGDVAGQLSQAVLDLGAIPIEEADFVQRGAVLTDVADEAGLAVDVRLVAHDVAQELTGGADKGPAIVLLVFAWSLANDGDPVIDAIDDDRVLVGNEPAKIGDHFSGGSQAAHSRPSGQTKDTDPGSFPSPTWQCRPPYRRRPSIDFRRRTMPT